jgi:hypothetical protein
MWKEGIWPVTKQGIELDLNKGGGRRGISAMKTWVQNRPKLIHVNIHEKWLCRLFSGWKRKNVIPLTLQIENSAIWSICGWNTYLPVWPKKKFFLFKPWVWIGSSYLSSDAFDLLYSHASCSSALLKNSATEILSVADMFSICPLNATQSLVYGGLYTGNIDVQDTHFLWYVRNI